MKDIKTSLEGTIKKIAFCEADQRIIAAAKELAAEGIIHPVLVGNTEEFKALGSGELPIIEPNDRYSKDYYDLRKNKGITEVEARETSKHPAYYSAFLALNGEVDGVVCGATWPTATTLQAALHILREGLASSYFFMETPRGDYYFADCAFNINPDAEQLSSIAYNTALEAEKRGDNPVIALLSYSTKGSAPPTTETKKVEEATKLLQEKKRPNWIVDGPLQVDAAIEPSIATKKCPGSPVQGRANILIFPSLDAGNIGYKLVQRFTGGKAIGPIITGFKKPMNDLSRGCTEEEIKEVAYITAWQSI